MPSTTSTLETNWLVVNTTLSVAEMGFSLHAATTANARAELLKRAFQVDVETCPNYGDAKEWLRIASVTTAVS